MRLSFSESDIDPKTQLSPAVNQAAVDHIAEQERAVGWVDPDKTRVVPAAELAAWHAIAATPPAVRAAEAKQSDKSAGDDAEKADDEQETEKEPKTFLGLNLPQVIGGVLASTTAAILGGQLGVAGTVVGAAMTTGIITVGGAIYSHGIKKTTSKLGSAAGRFRLGGTTPLKNVPDVSADPTEAIHATELLDGRDQDQPDAGSGSWRDKISPVKLLATAAAIFILAAVVITGLEALRGESFSGGGQTTVGQISERSTSGSTGDSDAGTTEPQRNATQPAAEPTPASETPAPVATPSSEPTPTPGAVEPTAPAPGSGDNPAGDGFADGGTDGAGSDTGTDSSGAPSGPDSSGSSTAQSDADASESGQ